ncbi:MAG: hypothetical protein IMW89_10465 [Ktedonobacteraceae bacterium]|nr:hypothetical protein [Ktedonobacteraceae bacterium]
MYYRIATINEQHSAWKWRSSNITSLHALFQLLRAYEYLSKDQVRIFFASSTQMLGEMLERANRGGYSNSMSFRQFLAERRKIDRDRMRQIEEALKAGGDHDEPYIFTLPPTPQARAWIRLMLRVRNGSLEP